MRAYLAAVALCLTMNACAAFGLVERPVFGARAEATTTATDPVEAARAAVSLAEATASLNALVAAPGGAGRSLVRGETGGVGGPEDAVRIVARGDANHVVPNRTLVTVTATAGPPIADDPTEAAPARHRRGATETFALPVEQPRVTSRYGPRIDPLTGQRGRMHRGTDFGGPVGTPVLATASGSVVLGGYCDRGTGNCVVLDHAGGWRSQYFHLSRVRVRPGQVVAQGEVIGEVGSTGRSTGPHLHFQLGRDGEAVDPETLFGRRVE